MTPDNDEKKLMDKLDLMIKLLGSIRDSLEKGVPRAAVEALRDDLQSLTSAVQILSRTLTRGKRGPSA